MKSIYLPHVLSCFFGGHRFERLTDRDGHHEYICHGCGHQLLVHSANDPWEAKVSFWKRPRYWCSVFGHRVRSVAERSGLTEYACDCGHSFLKQKRGLRRIKHPLTCTVLGHFVRFLDSREGYSEYVCRICGHTFCYAGGLTVRGRRRVPESEPVPEAIHAPLPQPQ